MRVIVATLLLVPLAGCPNRGAPERGVELVYSKPAGSAVLAAAEKRLKRAGLRAGVSEAGATLTVRVAAGEDAARAKDVLGRVGRLELCEELEADELAACERVLDGGVALERELVGGKVGCYFAGADRASVRAASSGATSGRVLVSPTRDRVRSWFAAATCLVPRLTGVRVIPTTPAGDAELGLLLDEGTQKELTALTERLLGRRLLVVLDGEVLLGVTVLQPLAVESLPVSWPGATETTLEPVAAALEGGPIDGLMLTAERPFGPQAQ